MIWRLNSGCCQKTNLIWTYGEHIKDLAGLCWPIFSLPPALSHQWNKKPANGHLYIAHMDLPTLLSGVVFLCSEGIRQERWWNIKPKVYKFIIVYYWENPTWQVCRTQNILKTSTFQSINKILSFMVWSSEPPQPPLWYFCSALIYCILFHMIIIL